MENEYTFVTLDNDMVTTGDAVFVDIDDAAGAEADFVQIDDTYAIGAGMQGSAAADNSLGFITMDDMGGIDADIDSYSSDISEADVSIIL